MPYWLKSYENNSSIDFFLVTDVKDLEIPNNVHIINISLKGLKALTEKN